MPCLLKITLSECLVIDSANTPLPGSKPRILKPIKSLAGSIAGNKVRMRQQFLGFLKVQSQADLVRRQKMQRNCSRAVYNA